jgi:hypothetical protein
MRPTLTLRKNDPAPEVGPAAAALAANRQRADGLVIELAEKTKIAAAVQAALVDAEAKAAAPGALREQIEQVEAGIQAKQELTGALVDMGPLTALQAQLAIAEREAAGAPRRVLVETKKLEELNKEISQLHAVQRDVQGRIATLGVEALWEDLATKAAALSAARSAYVVAHDAAFATARAIDRVAEETKSGRFANSAAAGALCLPMVEGMKELPYSATEHWQRLETAAVALLREMGLHS